jgi:hypothetical protein
MGAYLLSRYHLHGGSGTVLLDPATLLLLLQYTVKQLRTKVVCFSKISYHTLHDSFISGGSLSATSQFRASAMLVNECRVLKIRSYFDSVQWHNAHTEFHQNAPSCSQFEACGHTTECQFYIAVCQNTKSSELVVIIVIPDGIINGMLLRNECVDTSCCLVLINL